VVPGFGGKITRPQNRDPAGGAVCPAPRHDSSASSMIEIGRYGKQAMAGFGAGLAVTR
jgi:hypothetical protein